MAFKSIIGQSLAVELSQKWLQRQTTQPLVFFGPDGVGKKALALEIAKALNCLDSLKQDGCDRCLSCRKIAGGIHPDVRVVDLALQAAERDEPLEKQLNLRIETILKERHRLLQSALEGRWKVLILDDAHRLTPDAANVFLKVLEEPPAQTAIFLLTAFRDRLLATLLSRCQPVRFRPLSDEEMRQCLIKTITDPDADFAAVIELAQGSPGRAIHVSRQEQIQLAREAETLWETLSREAPLPAEGRGKGSRPARMDVEQRIQSLSVPAARALRSGDLKAGESIRLIQNALTQLRQNVSPALVYDYLILKLAQARQ